MKSWPKDIRLFAKQRWHDGATLQQIADEIADRWEIKTNRQQIHMLAKNNRAHFPERSRDQINARISEGMVRAYEKGKRKRVFGKAKKKKQELVTDGW